MAKHIAVRYMALPAIEKGISGFYEYPADKNCVDPSNYMKTMVVIRSAMNSIC